MNDTICAIATPPGRGGVGIVRISGPAVADIANALTARLPEPRRARLVTVKDATGEVLDEGLALYFPAPASFTGEDVLELQLHGAPVVLEQVLAAAVAAGARRAAPGEFSQRAFVNGKLDLAQAEAIADLIDAATTQAARAARRSLEGELSRKVEALAQEITNLRIFVEAALDFPDEEIDFLSDGDVGGRIAALIADTEALADQARAGQLLTEGLRVAIVGKPNAGKSSLFNALVRRDAAIVTEVPGTTRDVLRESLSLGGMPVLLADTAGLRETDDVVEREGVRRTHAELEQADLVLWVVDATDAEPGPAPNVPVPCIRINNKSDLPDARRSDDDTIAVSALTGLGLDALDQSVARHCGLLEREASAFSARARHVEQIAQTLSFLQRAAEVLATGEPAELIAEELHQAADALGEITGRLHSDDLLGLIFSSFCIGK
ncbi:MAG: tRNA uridine-5-carboxymethylaminomethyl(34) synthesis GTPase MnmE [Wenzhouxiangellaceae bacterium]|nr:tRNA uridine-5-carboxymethylaminomethyl(34) synthesis GTPase MnmE [Wenzhouxiangellaceae bacterium]